MILCLSQWDSSGSTIGTSFVLLYIKNLYLLKHVNITNSDQSRESKNCETSGLDRKSNKMHIIGTQQRKLKLDTHVVKSQISGQMPHDIEIEKLAGD